ncbi:MAG: phosphate ABC transporter permease PstA [Phycisphaerales bacterium]
MAMNAAEAGNADRLRSRVPLSDRAAQYASAACALIVCLVLVMIAGDVVWRGVSHVSVSFLTHAASDAGRSGGIGPMIVSTGLIVMVCMFAAIPVAIATAIAISEFIRPHSLMDKVVRSSLFILAAVPSIVFGLFGNAVFVKQLGMGFSILSGGLTLACMVLPITTFAAVEGLRAVPGVYRHAAAALSLSRIATVMRVLLPQALPGVLAGVVLGAARALAETAALLFTSGYVDRMPGSLLDSGRALSVHILDLAMNVAGGEPNAYASACVLVGMMAVISLCTHALLRFSSRRNTR